MFLCECLILREWHEQLLLCVIMSLLLLLHYIVIWINHKSPVSISSIFHDLTERIPLNPMTLTAFVFTELANTMKYGGGLLYNLVFIEWRHWVSQNEVWGRGSYITLFSQSDVTTFYRIATYQDDCCLGIFLGTFPSPLLSDEVGPYGWFQKC